MYVYSNLWNGTVGTATTSWMFLEPNNGSLCTDTSSKWYIFNNYFSSSDQVPTNPYLGSVGAVPLPIYVYNNTFARPGLGHYGANASACVFASREFLNNAVGGCARLFDTSASPHNFNAYANTTGNNCFPTGGCNWATWKATGRDANSVYNASGATGSNTANVATNLTSLCGGNLAPLCRTRLGAPRPATGPWNAGSD